MKALILAGGFGTRMGSLTQKIPKVMLPIAGKPLLEHLLLQCRKYDIFEIILSVYHHADVIRRHFGDGLGFGVRIVYRQERQPRGSGGALNEARDLLTDRFLVMNGDVMNRVNIRVLVQFHDEKRGIGTLVVHPSEHPYDSDMIEVNDEKRILRIFRPKKSEKFKNLANAGMFVFDPEILQFVQSKKMQSLEKDVLPATLTSGMALYAYETDEYIKDIGTRQRYREVKEEQE